MSSLKKRRQISNEISFLSFCNHQNIVPFEDAFQFGDEIWVKHKTIFYYSIY